MRHPDLADKSDSCLVVVDMQEPFLRTVFDRSTVVENARKLISAAKILDMPILATLQYPEKMGDTIPEIKELLPSDEPISKMAFSCCGEESFDRRLAELGRRTVILTGVEAHICISQTAHDLLIRGYTVHVPGDAVCSRQESDWLAGLEKMRRSGVIVTSTSAVMFELLVRADTDEFRKALDLLK